MQTPETVQCPFCGQSFEVMLETSVSSQNFITDCEICCRPLQIRAECEEGETLSLEVQPA